MLNVSVRTWRVSLPIAVVLVMVGCAAGQLPEERGITAEFLQKLTPLNVQAGSNLGQSVAVCGDYIVVGAHRKNGAGGTKPLAGSAWVFHRTAAAAWDSGFELIAPDAYGGDYFGWSVAISGDHVIVGATGEDGDDDDLSDAGAAYIYHRTGTNAWDAGIKLAAADLQAADGFGSSVSISGDYAVVGAPSEDGGVGDPLPAAGAAYVFHRIGPNAWDAGTKLVAPDAQAGDKFGDAVAISGDSLIVGAAFEDGGPGDPLAGAGAAYLFARWGDNAWDAGTRISALDAQTEDYFGASVAIDGEYAVVGAVFEDGGPGDPAGDAGAAYIFHRSGPASWEETAKLVAPDAQSQDGFGISVSISGGYALVGANGECGGAGDPLQYAGAAYLFHRADTTIWDSGTKIVADDAQARDGFGRGVTISDDNFVVGAPDEDGGVGDPFLNCGAAYQFE